MMPHRIVIAGFGNVGQRLASLIAEDHPATKGIVVTGVSDPRFGTVASPDPLDLSEILTRALDGGFEGHPAQVQGGVAEMIDFANAETLVEVTHSDLETGEPATTHIRHAIHRAMNVSTTNKGPIALNYRELGDLASARGVALSFEGTVMSGTPVIQVATTLARSGCHGVRGILNGTTNYLITRMEAGTTYEDALLEAQHHGYAEADPTGDVDGRDSAAKLAILSHLLAARPVSVSDIERVPVSTISRGDVSTAEAAGEKWRYIASLEERDGVWQASVSPQRISADDPLAAITGVTNAVTFSTDLLGDVTLAGPGAGRSETAFAVLSDLRQIAEHVRRVTSGGGGWSLIET